MNGPNLRARLEGGPGRRLAAVLRGAAWGLLAFVAGFPAAVLAVAERGTIALGLAVACLVVALIGPARLRVGFGVAAAMVSAGGAWGALAYDSVEQSSGGLVATISDPAAFGGERDRTRFRAGQGRVLVDLRTLRVPASAPSGTRAPTYRLAARADTDTVVVALPRTGCYRLVVRVRPLTSRPSVYEQAAPLVGLRIGPDGDRYEAMFRGGGQTEAEGMQEQDRRTASGPPPLLAFGLPVRPVGGRWVREVAVKNAPTIEIEARAAAQVVLRDYPASLPLGSPDLERVNLAWPSGPSGFVGQYPPDLGGTGRDDDQVLAERLADGQLVFRNGLSSAARSRIDAARRREDAWGRRTAARFAGPCATKSDLARRSVPLSYLQYGTPVQDVQVEVNGLGVRRAYVRDTSQPVSLALPTPTAAAGSSR